MTTMEPGIVRSQDSLDAIRWNILGQIYVPKQLTDDCFSWHATLPPGTFVPPHIHPDQDEFLYILEGRFEFILDARHSARYFQQLGLYHQNPVLGDAFTAAL